MKLLLKRYTWPAHMEARLELAKNFLSSSVKAASLLRFLHAFIVWHPVLLRDVSWISYSQCRITWYHLLRRLPSGIPRSRAGRARLARLRTRLICWAAVHEKAACGLTAWEPRHFVVILKLCAPKKCRTLCSKLSSPRIRLRAITTSETFSHHVRKVPLDMERRV